MFFQARAEGFRLLHSREERERPRRGNAFVCTGFPLLFHLRSADVAKL